MSITSEIRLRIKKEGDVALTQLSAKLNDVASRSVVSNKKFKDLAATLRNNDNQIKGKSINALNDYSRAWRELANSVDVTSKEFKEATREAQRFERQAAKAQGRRGQGRLGTFARGAGGVMAAGIFGGPEGALGALAGLPFGPGGVAAGAAFGATVGSVRQQLGGTAEYAASLAKQRLALQLVTKEAGQYQRALDFVDRTSRKFAIPQEIITRQFTKLTASVKGAGGSVADAEKAFLGVAAGIRGTGGSLQDLDSALTATSQVFSKGKVSAEELRQQIGERLPGAFTLFAESMGLTPQELDKALEDGKVSLLDFQKFAEKLFKEYGIAAQAIADSPAAAGDRLKTTLGRLSESVGDLLRPIGAAFQSEFAKAVDAIDKAIRKLNEFLGLGKGRQGEIEKLEKDIANTQRKLKDFADLRAKRGGLLPFGQYETETRLFERYAEMTAKLQGLRAAEKATQELRPDKPKGLPGYDEDLDTDKGPKMRTTSKELLELSERRTAAAKDRNQLAVELINYEMAIQQATEQFNNKEIDFNTARKITNEENERLQKRILALRKQEKRELANLSKGQKEVNKELTEAEKIGKAVVLNFADRMADAFFDLIDRATTFREVLSGLLRDTGKLILQLGIRAGVKGLFPDLFAMGGIMSNDGAFPLKKYARGGVANSPQLAMFGEGSTPEAYVPLPDGRTIPVTMKNGGKSVGNVVVNVDASGSGAEGDSQQANRLGEAIGVAVRQELIKQQRPGGLLA